MGQELKGKILGKTGSGRITFMKQTCSGETIQTDLRIKRAARDRHQRNYALRSAFSESDSGRRNAGHITHRVCFRILD